MSLKSLSLGVGISAFLSGGFMATTQKANSEFQKMGAETKKLSQHNKALQNFDLKKGHLQDLKAELALQKQKLLGLQQERDSIKALRAAGKMSHQEEKAALADINRAIRGQEKVIDSLNAKYQKNTQAFVAYAQKWQAQGVHFSKRKEQIEQLGQSLDRLTRKQNAYNQIQDRKAKMGQAMGELKPTALTGVPMLLNIGASIKASSEYRVEMTRIGNTANMTREQSKALGDELLNASVKVGVAATTLQEGLGEMVAGGIDPAQSIKAVDSMGNVIKAYKADAKDVGATNIALINHMGYTADQLTRPWDMLASAANQGNFELKDIAQSIPSIGAAMKSLKLNGDEGTASMGAWLQIAKRGAGNASEAANNFQNFLQKVTSNDAEKRSKAMGFSLREVVAKAQKEGKNPIDAAIEKIKDVTGGDQVKIGQLFADAQVQNFLRPAIQGWDEYKQIKDNALKGDGTVDRDAEKVNQEVAAKSEKAGAAWQKFKVKFGDAMAPLWGKVLTGFTVGLTKLTSGIDKIGEGWTQAFVAIGGGLWVGLMGWKIWKIGGFVKEIFGFKKEIKALSDGVGWLSKLGGAAKKVFSFSKTIGKDFFVDIWKKIKVGGQLLKGMGQGVIGVAKAFGQMGSMAAKGLLGVGKSLGFKGWNLSKMLGLKALNLGKLLSVKGFNLTKMLGLKALNLGKFLVFKGGSALMSGLRMAGSAMGTVLRAGGALARVLGGSLVRGLLTAGRAVLFIGRALLMNPIGLLVTAIAVGGYLIYRNWSTLKPMFVSVFNTAKAKATAAWTSIKGAWGGVKAWFGAKVEGIKSVFRSLPSAFTEFGRNIVQGLLDGISARWEALTAKFHELASLGSRIFRSTNEINSPSRLFKRHAFALPEGAALGVRSGIPLLLRAVDDFSRSAGDRFKVKAPALQVSLPAFKVAGVADVGGHAGRVGQGAGNDAAGMSVTAGGNVYRFYITQAAGEDGEALAQRIMRMIEQKSGARRRSLLGDLA